MIAYVKRVDDVLESTIRSAIPVGVKFETLVVENSLSSLHSIADDILDATRDDPNVVGVSIAPQNNSVIVRTRSGSWASAYSSSTVDVIRGQLSPVGCTTQSRCSLRPFRGGEGLQDQW